VKNEKFFDKIIFTKQGYTVFFGILPASAGVFPGKKLLKNGKYNLTCKCGGVSEYWEEKGKKVCISLQGAKAPFFLLCFSIARKNSRERASASLSGKISSCVA
jgi:hypothetical protein